MLFRFLCPATRAFYWPPVYRTPLGQRFLCLKLYIGSDDNCHDASAAHRPNSPSRFQELLLAQGKAVAGVIAGYSAVCIVTGLFAVEFLGVLPAGSMTAPVTGSIVLYAVHQLSPLRGDAMRRCHRSVALTPRGSWQLTWIVFRFGFFHGFACVMVCFPLMLATIIAMPGLRLPPCWLS